MGAGEYFIELKINLLHTNLNEQLKFTDLEIDDLIQRSESAIYIIINSIEKLKVIFEKEKSKSQEQEFDFFFKNIKPKFTSKTVFLNAVFNTHQNPDKIEKL
jgi:hypothetical protein